MPNRLTLTLLVALAAATVTVSSQNSGRALTIEDYYRVQTVGAPSLSDDGRTVTFTIATRIESDNSTKTDTWSVATDGGGEPKRVESTGESAGTGRGGRGGRGASVTSPDGKWIAQTIDKPQPKADPRYASDFERRHQERFKGAIFDWKDFQRDGQPFPAPNQRARPAAQIVPSAPSSGGDREGC